MNHVDALFLRTLDDLEKRIASQDEYEILGASALLRKLLIDDQPLVDQVNREYRIRLKFEITAPHKMPEGTPEPMFFSVQDGIDPDTAPPFLQRLTATRDQFFASKLLYVNGQPYTLKDIILFEANMMGAVHAGSPKEEKEKVLAQLNIMFQIGGHRSSLRQLQAIGRVVLKGLKPLQEAVKKKHGV
jgi:hypothetical protein